MDLELKIKNIGKLTNAKIRIGQFTVFAGPNSTGKSFVSKSLYSIFDAMNANHAEVYINKLTNPVRMDLNRLIRRSRADDDDSPLHLLAKEIAELGALATEPPIGDFEEMDKIMPDIIGKAEHIREVFLRLRPSLETILEQDRHRVRLSVVKEILDRMEESLTELQKNLIDIDNAEEFIASGIEYKIRENLIQNFQVPNLSELRGNEDVPSKVDIENFGKFEFSDEGIGFNIGFSGFRQLQQYSKVIYLESPVYWKLKNALENIRISPRFLYSDREQISGIPGYFYDLASALRQQYSGDMDFPEIYDKLTGKDILGGKIAISDGGDLSFQENDGSFSLPVTAMGVTNLGILALLIERKVLDKGSFIFIDEPEAHLHPAWQVEMAKTLFALAKGGAHVVIATHSADILKWLEVHIKNNPDDEGMVALNKFPVNGDDFDDQDFGDKIAAIKKELTKPFADLYAEGL